MAANCNILSLVKKKVDSIIWGVACSSNDRDIIQNILRNSNCGDIKGINYCKDDEECIINAWNWDNNDIINWDSNDPMTQS